MEVVDITSGPVMRSQLFCKAKLTSLRMTALIVIAFIVCWTPYQVLFIVYTFLDSAQIDSRYGIWIFFFGMANSMINPLIYGAFQVVNRKSKHFRLVLCPIPAFKAYSETLS